MAGKRLSVRPVTMNESGACATLITAFRRRTVCGVVLLKTIAQLAGLACQLVGFAILLKQARAARELIRLGADRVIDGGDAAGTSQQRDLSDVALLYLNGAAASVPALATILAGILLTFLGSIL